MSKRNRLIDQNYFDFINGLWTGKKPPYSKAFVIRNTNFTNTGQIDYSDIAILDVETKQLEKKSLKAGDIIVERSGGGPNQPVGRVVYFDMETTQNAYSFSNFTSVIRVKDNDVFYPLYVFYFLLYFYLSGETNDLQHRTTGIRNLDFTSYKEKIAFPSIAVPEQKAIARVLTTIQEAIAGQEVLIATLKELKKSMMQYLFTHGTKGEKTKMTEIGEMPESWGVVRINEVGNVFYGIQAAVASLFKPIGYKIITNKNITLDGNITFGKINYYEPKTKRELSSFVESGDVLFNWRSGSKEHVGKTAIYSGSEKLLHSSFILKIRTYPDKMVNKFLFYYLNWLRETGYYVKLQTYSVNAKFNKSAVLNQYVIMPTLDEQNVILHALDLISVKLSTGEQKLSVYQNLFKTLLHELMGGERRIRTI